MSKEAQLKVPSKSYLNIRPFYCAGEFLKFKKSHNMYKSFFPTVCCMDLV